MYQKSKRLKISGQILTLLFYTRSTKGGRYVSAKCFQIPGWKPFRQFHNNHRKNLGMTVKLFREQCADSARAEYLRRLALPKDLPTPVPAPTTEPPKWKTEITIPAVEPAHALIGELVRELRRLSMPSYAPSLFPPRSIALPEELSPFGFHLAEAELDRMIEERAKQDVPHLPACQVADQHNAATFEASLPTSGENSIKEAGEIDRFKVWDRGVERTIIVKHYGLHVSCTCPDVIGWQFREASDASWASIKLQAESSLRIWIGDRLSEARGMDTATTRLEATFDETFKKLQETLRKKRADYSGGTGDPYANFNTSETVGVHPVIGMLMRTMDKFQRIRAFIANGTLAVATESVEDAIDDSIGYLILMKGWFREKRRGQAEKGADTYCEKESGK